MNGFKIAGIVSLVIIIGTFAYFVLNLAALERLELRSTEENFGFFDIVNDEPIKICNNFPFWASFDRIEITAYYQDEDMGTYFAPSGQVMPSSSLTLEGKFRSESFSTAQFTFMGLDAELTNDPPKRLDPSQAFIITEMHTRILGFIPVHVSDHYLIANFNNMMVQDC